MAADLSLPSVPAENVSVPAAKSARFVAKSVTIAIRQRLHSSAPHP
jgi:hypothetical protein